MWWASVLALVGVLVVVVVALKRSWATGTVWKEGPPVQRRADHGDSNPNPTLGGFIGGMSPAPGYGPRPGGP